MSQEDFPALRSAVFLLRIIGFALIIGQILFVLIAVVVLQTQNGPALPSEELVVWILAGIGVLNLLLQFVLPAILLNSARARLRARPPELCYQGLLDAYRAATIMAWATCEGAGFVMLLGYLLTGNACMLGIAAVAIVLTLARFPTTSGLANWIVRQRELLAEQAV
jgi:hypothetical protein